MTKKHFVVLLTAALWLHAGAPSVNSIETGGALVRQAMLALGPGASKQDIAMGEAQCRQALELAAADSADAAAAHNVLGAILEISSAFC